MFADFKPSVKLAIDEFALKLAADLAARYPPALENEKPRKRNPQRLAKAFDDTFNRAIDFQQEQKLGIYGKARLGNTFKWELKRLGYPDDFIDLTTSSLVKFVASQRSAKIVKVRSLPTRFAHVPATDAPPAIRVPLMTVQLPTVDRITPYLTRIDRYRWYSNFGP